MVLSGRFSRRFLVAAALAGSGVLVAGCGGSSHKTVSFVRAADISSDAPGYKMDMTMQETIGGQTINATANGAFTPKSHEAAATVTMSLPASLGGHVQMQMVMANGTFYVQLPATLASKIPGDKPWISVNLDKLGQATNLQGLGSLLSSTSTLNDPGEYLDFLRAASAGSVKNLGQETIDGVETTHYQGELDYSKFPDAVQPADRQGVQELVSELEKRAKVANMPVDVWIDGSNLVRQIKMNMDETVQGQTVSVVMTEDFTDYGAQPAPAVPASSDTTDLLSLLKNSGG